MAVDRSSWDGDAALRSCSNAGEFRQIAFERDNDSDPDTASHWTLPHHKRPGAPPNAGGVSSAVGALNGARGGKPDLKNESAARSHLEAHQRQIEGSAKVTSKLAERRSTVEVIATKQTGMKGEATLLASRWGPDHAIAWGMNVKQFMEQGAFKAWIESEPFPLPWYGDHGDAPLRGLASAMLLAGHVKTARETMDGLEIDVRYLLSTQLGHDLFEQVADPETRKLVQVSYGWDPTRDVTLDRKDGMQHVVETWPVEFSHVTEGAGSSTGVLAAASQRERDLLVQLASENAKWLLHDTGFKTALVQQLLDDHDLARDLQTTAAKALEGHEEESFDESDEIVADRLLAEMFASARDLAP